jgi:glycosyltransferase involved in cell wall biosynthesis
VEPDSGRAGLRVLAVVPYPVGRAPGQRYRIEQWAPLLAAQDVAVVFRPFLPAWGLDVLYRRGHLGTKALAVISGYWRRSRLLTRVSQYDVAFVYREAAPLGPACYERILGRRLPMVFDFDDALHQPDLSPANRVVGWFKPRGRAACMCRMSKHVTVGNETLAAFARCHAAAVTVIPSTIDTDLYTVRPRPANARPVVGWTGSETTVRYLQALLPTLRRLRQRIEFELRVIGGKVDLVEEEGRFVPWQATTEVEDLRPLDVGLMPLADDEWSRGKCGMKALQYMALAIAPVVSPVGVNAAIVQDGVNGFHAKSEEEWMDRIALLLRNPQLRETFGRAARRTVEASYSAKVQAPRLAAVLRSVAGAARCCPVRA